jgi:hypothetical protein
MKRTPCNIPVTAVSYPLCGVKKGRGDVKRANGKVSQLKSNGSLALLEMAIAIEQEGSISISSQGLYMLLKNI